jgi:hypothetical protein
MKDRAHACSENDGKPTLTESRTISRKFPTTKKSGAPIEVRTFRPSLNFSEMIHIERLLKEERETAFSVIKENEETIRENKFPKMNYMFQEGINAQKRFLKDKKNLGLLRQFEKMAHPEKKQRWKRGKPKLGKHRDWMITLLKERIKEKDKEIETLKAKKV